MISTEKLSEIFRSNEAETIALNNISIKNNTGDFMNLSAQLNQVITSIIMLTHSESDSSYAQRIIRLFDGEIIQELS